MRGGLMFKLATIEVKRAPLVALALGDALYEVETTLAAYRRAGGPALLAGVTRPVTMLRLLEHWPRALRDLQRLAKFVEAGDDRRRLPRLPAARAKFRAPILYPPRIFAAGSNYTAHSREMTDKLRPGTPYTTRENSNPYCFLQASIGPVIGHREKILASRVPDPKIDWEGELAVVVGKRARSVSPQTARAAI